MNLNWFDFHQTRRKFLRSTVLCTVSVVLPVPNFSAIVSFVCKRLNFIFPRNWVSENSGDMSEIVWNWDSSKVTIRAVEAKNGAAQRFTWNCDFHLNWSLTMARLRSICVKINKTKNFKSNSLLLCSLENGWCYQLWKLNIVTNQWWIRCKKQIRMNVLSYQCHHRPDGDDQSLNVNVRLRTTNTWWST